ncbi:MAG: iron-sulfur cluster insertion protein ErpA [SAR202 cluster bacterium]|nr:iron-sulfur cluster insertion protein ErpA [SAR202 cluster bacterium]
MAPIAVDPTITITDKAAAQVKKLTALDGHPEPVLRVAVQGGGCSGLTYKLSFEREPRQGDKVFEQHGVKLVVDGKSFIFLVGTHLDFSDGLNGKGFVFSNPNAKRTCGCGTSFSA